MEHENGEILSFECHYHTTAGFVILSLHLTAALVTNDLVVLMIVKVEVHEQVKVI